MYLIVYETNKKTLYRLRSTFPLYDIGDVTSMSWKVLDIQIFYKDSFYTMETIHSLIYYRKIKEYKKEKRKNKISKIINLLAESLR